MAVAVKKKRAASPKSKRAPLPVAIMNSEAKVGRPALYKPEYAEIGKRAAMLGPTNDALAIFFGVSPSTIDDWIRDYEEFRSAINEGKNVADSKMAESLFHSGMGYSHPAIKIMTRAIGDGQSVIEEVPYTEHYPPNATSMIFWLKNRRPDLWRDRVEFDNKGNPLTAMTINNDNRTQTVNVTLTAEQAAEEYKRLIKGD